MFRIDDPSATPSLPAQLPAGTPGYFSRGNPGSGIRPTTLTVDWANIVQEELMAILAAAGITPAKGDTDQVLDALNVLYRPGRILREVSLFSATGATATGTYVASAGTNFVHVRMVGGGGAGGGTLATAVGESAAGSGGASGTYCEFVVGVSYVHGQVWQVGGRGVGVAGANGGDGAASMIGAATAPGGKGGFVGTNTAIALVAGQGLTGVLPTMPGVLDELIKSRGVPGFCGLVVTAGASGTSLSGHGGSGPWGGGGENTNSGTGPSADGPGSGGGGAASVSTAVARAGGNGSAGRIIVRDLS